MNLQRITFFSLKSALLLLVSFCFVSATQAEEVYIKVGEAQVRKSLIAFPPLQFSGTPASSPNYQNVGAELYRTVFNDLNAMGYFQFMDPKAFLEDTSKTALIPAPASSKGFRWESWRTLKTDFLIRAAYSISGGQLSVETYTYSVSKGQLVLGKKYKGPVGSVRKVAHTFANDLVKALTGQDGMFLSRLVFSSDRGGGKFREIYAMDWDGDNLQKLTNHRSIALSPSWSPDGTKIAYSAFVRRVKSKKENVDLFVYEFKNGNRWQVSYREGINSGSAWGPDERSLFLTISQGSSPDIFKIGLDGGIIKRITNGPRGAMNVEPAISKDGRKIAFSSDRSGQPMIYTMDADGGSVKRITFAGKYNSTPTWSPDGKKIAFAGYLQGNYDIFVVNADGTGLERLTQSRKSSGKAADSEDPSFSPDGRHIVFTSNRTGKKQIYMVNIDGTNERRITQDTSNYFKPKWSANLE